MSQTLHLLPLGSLLLLLAGCSLFRDEERRFIDGRVEVREDLDAGRLESALEHVNRMLDDENHDFWYELSREDVILLGAQVDEAVVRYDYATGWYRVYAVYRPNEDLSLPKARVAAKRRTLELHALAEQIAARPDDPAPRLERLRILGVQLDHLRWDPDSRKQVDYTAADRALAEADFARLQSLLSPADFECARTHYHLSQHDLANAGTSAMAAIVAAPEGDWFPYFALGVCVEAQQPDLAIGCYSKAIELQPAQAKLEDRPQPFLRCAALLAQRYERTQEAADADRATQVVNSLIELEPEFAEARIMLSKISMARGDYDAAYQAAGKALELKYTPEAECHYLRGMAVAWSAFPPGTTPDPSEEWRLFRRPTCVQARIELDAATKSPVYDHDARVHWILATLCNEILDVHDDDSKEHWTAQAHARKAAELDPKLPPVDLWRADQLQAYKDQRSAERSDRLGLLMAGIDPNTGERMRDDGPPPARTWVDELREIDWSQAPGNSGAFSGMVGANQAAGAELQRQIDTDASWSKFKNELEAYGHTSSKPR